MCIRDRTLSHASDATFLTVEVDIPTRTKTTTVPWTGTATTSYTVTAGNTFTKVVETPVSRTTITKNWNSLTHTTTTNPFNPTSDTVLTVEVWEPTSTTSYLTSYYTGVSEVFSTYPFSDVDQTITVLDLKPYPRTTRYIPSSDTTSFQTNPLTNSAGSTTGLEIVKYSPVKTVTSTYIWSTSTRSTTTKPFKTDASVVTVVVNVPPMTVGESAKCGPTNGVTRLPCSSGLYCNSNNPATMRCVKIGTVTTTKYYTGSTPSFTTLPYVTSDTTVVAYLPPQTVTRTSPWDHVYTTTTTKPYATDDATVYVDVDIPVTTTIRSTWSSTEFSTTTKPVDEDSTKYTVVIYGPPVSTFTSTSKYTGSSSSSYTISNNPTQVTLVEMEPLPRVTVTRGWTFATPQTTTFGCGDVEQGNPTQNIFHKRQVNPYDQYCDPDATTTELTVVVHVPFITATTQIPYTGKTTSTSISLSDGGLTETIINYVPNSVCANTGSACGSISTSGSAVFGVQTACCQLGLRCATDSSNVICCLLYTSRCV